MGDSVISARPNRLITLGVQDAAPPTDSYISQDDQLFTHIVNSAPGITVYITVRLLLPDGRIQLNQFAYLPFSTRVNQQFAQFLAEGFLLSVTATGGPTNVGQTYLNVTIARNLPVGTFPASGAYGEILLQGYLTGANALTWPRGQIGSTQSLQGYVRSITGTTPAAGAEISETVPINAIWRLKSFWFRLTTSAAVANRTPHMVVTDGTNTVVDTPANLTQAASLVLTWQYIDGSASSVGNDGVAFFRAEAGMLLASGYKITTVTTALQAGDQYTAPQYVVEEWINS